MKKYFGQEGRKFSHISSLINVKVSQLWRKEQQESDVQTGVHLLPARYYIEGSNKGINWVMAPRLMFKQQLSQWDYNRSSQRRVKWIKHFYLLLFTIHFWKFPPVVISFKVSGNMSRLGDNKCPFKEKGIKARSGGRGRKEVCHRRLCASNLLLQLLALRAALMA